MKNLIFIILISILSCNLYAQKPVWEQLYEMKKEIEKKETLDDNGIRTHIETVNALYNSLLSTSNQADKDLATFLKYVNLTQIKMFLIISKDSTLQQLTTNAYEKDLQSVIALENKFPIQFNYNGKALQYNINSYYSILGEMYLDMGNYYYFKKPKDVQKVLQYREYGYSSFSKVKETYTGNYVLSAFLLLLDKYSNMMDYSTQGIAMAVSTVNDIYKYNLTEQPIYKDNLKAIYSYLGFALKNKPTAEHIQLVQQLPTVIYTEKIKILKTANNILANRAILNILHTTPNIEESIENVMVKLEALIAIDSATGKGAYNASLDGYAYELFTYKEYKETAVYYDRMIKYNIPFTYLDYDAIITLKKMKIKNDNAVENITFTTIDTYLPTLLANKEKNLGTSCTAYQTMAADYALINNTTKVNEYTTKYTQCEAAIAKAAQQRKKQQEKNIKIAARKRSNTGVYIGAYPFELRKNTTMQPGYGGHIIFKGVKKALELGYISITQKQNGFNYVQYAKEKAEDDYKALWSGYRAHVGFRKYSKYKSTFTGLRAMYSHRALLPITKEVKNLTTNTKNNLTFNNAVEKQYTLLFITGVHFTIFNPLDVDFTFGLGGSYQQFDGGRVEYNNPKYEIARSVLTSKPTYISPQLDFKLSIGLNFKTVKR